MYFPTIGLEIHIELNTKSKMFCACRNEPLASEPNKNICPICSGQPGVLPAINSEAVKKIIKTGLALNCKIDSNTFFERKSYFYPDLPKGYQISQYRAPFGTGGYLDIQVSRAIDGNKSQTSNPESFAPLNAAEGNLTGQINSNDQNSKLKIKRIRIERIHLEEDAGKLLHPERVDYSLVDLNRAGVPLMELVTEPDIHSSGEAAEFVKDLQLILHYLGVSEANMEKGEMRCEVNISISETETQNSGFCQPVCRANGTGRDFVGQAKIKTALGTKVEVKNLNSIKAVEKSIEFEIKRQSEVLEKGEKVIRETRGWDDKKEITFSQRNKEAAHDYRYFPEPDLPVLQFSQKFLGNIKNDIPELPEQKRQRFAKEYHLTDKEIGLYVSQRDLGNYFEKVVSELTNWVKEKYISGISSEEFQKLIKLASNYISTDLQALLKERGIEIFNEDKFRITPENFAEFLCLIYLGEISSKIAKMLLSEMFFNGGDPSQIIADKSWQMVSNEEVIKKSVNEVVVDNPKAIEDFKKGKETSLQFLVGQVMAKTKGKANPQKVQEILKNLIK